MGIKVLLLFISVGLCQAGDNYFEACWEKCYQQIDNSATSERLRPAYFELYEMGMEARRLKNMRSVNGTVFLLDSSLSVWHDPETNPGLNLDEQAEKIWRFQLDLAIITAIMLGSDNDRNPLAVVQFNELSAWACDTHNCLDSCDVATLFEDATSITDVQLNATSHRDGNTEAACRLGKIQLNEYTSSRSACTGYPTELREMAIAVFNSDFHSHVHRSDEWDDYSPCDEHFDTRYAIGTHAAEYHKMKDWSSLDAHPAYIKDNMYTMEAARTLVGCMLNQCSCSSSSIDSASSCGITTDHFGEDIASFSAHPALSGP